MLVERTAEGHLTLKVVCAIERFQSVPAGLCRFFRGCDILASRLHHQDAARLYPRQVAVGVLQSEETR